AAAQGLLAAGLVDCWAGGRRVAAGQATVIRCQLPVYADPTFTLRNLAGAAPCPLPITCCGCPLPQCGVPQSTHSSREQIASREFQNSVVMPEYDGFFSMRVRLPFLISHPASQPN